MNDESMNALGDVLYRKWTVYSPLAWADHGVQIEHSSAMCGAPYGGPIAIVKEDKDKQAHKSDGGDSNPTSSQLANNDSGDAASNSSAKKGTTLRIFTSSGILLAEVEWEKTKKIAGMGWTDHEHLIIVLGKLNTVSFGAYPMSSNDDDSDEYKRITHLHFTFLLLLLLLSSFARNFETEDGDLHLLDINGKLVQNFLIHSNTSSSHHIVECQFWGNGVVCMASDMQIYVVDGFTSHDVTQGPRRYKMRSGLTAERPYTSMAIVPPLLSRSGFLEVMLGTLDNSILVIDEQEVEDQLLQDRIKAPITKMAVAPNGRFLACYRRDGVLTVMSATFTTKVLDFDTKSMSRPLDIAWCGDDAVVLLWRNTGIVMVGPYGDWLNFPYDGAVQLIAEPDCCRIITSTQCDMLQRVNSATEAIRKIGSTDPAALLYDAMEAFEEGDPKSDENIRSIAEANQLQDAIQSCINAAAAEFDIGRQQTLLKAASYGKTFCSDCDPSDFVDTARKLRALNHIRRPEVGIPLTMQQYNRLSSEALISRLTMRNHHLLALRICDLLKLKNERVLVHWACEKVKRMTASPTTDEEVARLIKKRLSIYGRISYLEIAASAYHMGRRRLATMILDLEQNAADQVPLLLSMQEEELALQKAINSEDTDLIYLTLIHLERSRPDLQTFHRLIYTHLEAANLLKVYYRSKITPTDRSILHNLLMYNKNYLEAGIAAINQAHLQPSIDGRIQLMRDASTLFGQGRDLTFPKTMTDEQVDLLDIQKMLEIRSHRSFIDLSLSETIYNIILLGLEHPSDLAMWEREVTKLVKKFRVRRPVHIYHSSFFRIPFFSNASILSYLFSACA